MNTVIQFFEAFKNKDAKTMIGLYSDQACFTDPVFGCIDHPKIEVMWSTIVRPKSDFRLDYTVLLSTQTHAEVKWNVEYTFNNRPIFNKVHTTMKFDDQKKIKVQIDDFDVAAWMGMAFGFPGKLLGKTLFGRLALQKFSNLKLRKTKALIE